MGRFNGEDNYDWGYREQVLWDQALYNASHSQRGRAVLEELRQALEAMPVRELAYLDIVTEDGAQCALGVLATHRETRQGKSVQEVLARLREEYGATGGDEYEAEEATDHLVRRLGLTRTLGTEISRTNDSDEGRRTPAERWTFVHGWVTRTLEEPALQRAPRKEPSRG